MPIITPAHLQKNIYAEIITEITRGDDTIIDNAIAAAIAEAKLYLGKYDLPALFGTADAPPASVDPLLTRLTTDIACWHLLRLSGPGADHAAYRTAYHDAISTLKSIMSGQARPEGWSYAVAAPEVPEGDAISWTSNPRRSNHY